MRNLLPIRTTPPRRNRNATAQAGSTRLLLLGVLGLIALSGIALTVLPTGPRKPIVRTTGEALVGGPFTMVDHTGATVTQDDFADRIMVIYFGFTFCPDVCPTQLLALTAALEQLGDDTQALAPLFVSVDPERDTPEVMAQYVEHFHPSLTGLTGSADQVKQMADAYYVTYYKVQDADTVADYLMDHTSIVYVMGRDGKYLTHFTHTATPDEMATALKKLM